MKKTISILLTMMILLSLAGIPAFADEDSSPTIGKVVVENDSNGGVSVTPSPSDNSKITVEGGTTPSVTVNANIDITNGMETTGLKVTYSNDSPVTVNVTHGASVTVNANNNGTRYAVGVETSDANATVTINENVTAKANQEKLDGYNPNTTATGVSAKTTTDVITNVNVNGNISAEAKARSNTICATGIEAEGGGVNVTVTGGDVSAKGEAEVTYIESIKASGGSTVNVKKDEEGNGGNVNSDGLGIDVSDGSTVTVDGNVKGKGCSIWAKNVNNSKPVSVTVNGDIEGAEAITAQSNNNSDIVIQVKGNIKASYGVGIENEGKKTEITVGDPNDSTSGKINAKHQYAEGISVTTKGSNAETIVTATGNVSAGRNGIETTNIEGSTIIAVTGNVTGNTSNQGGDGICADGGTVVVHKKESVEDSGNVSGSTGVQAENSANVTVEGSITGTDKEGVLVSDSATVMVGENVEGEKTGIGVKIVTEENSTDIKKGQRSTVIVEGTVSATGENGHVISLEVPNGAIAKTVKDALPEIIVQSIDSKADYVVCSGSTEADNKEIADAMLGSIKYIVEQETQYTEDADTSVTVELIKVEGVLESKDLNEKKTLTVATSSTTLKLGIDKNKGSIVGVVVSNAAGEKETLKQNENGDWIITVGTHGLKIIATVDKAKLPDVKPKEETTDKKGNTETEATAANNNAFSLNYKNHILTIDMTNTQIQTILADTMRRFQRNGFETVVIKVANGSFTVAMDDLIQMIGTAPSFTLKVSGDTLTISVGGNEVATLVMT